MKNSEFNKNKTADEIFDSHRSKNGLYSVAVIAIITVIVIALNIALSTLFVNEMEIDLSDKGVYTVTQTSEEFLANLKKPVEIVVLEEQAELDADKRIEKFLTNYTKLSDKVRYQVIDPVQNPTALETYSASKGDIVIRCEKTGRSTTLAIKDLYDYDYSEYFTTGTINATSFDMEGQVTTAVKYVSSDESYNAYFTSGHDEGEFSQTGLKMLNKLCLNIKQLEKGKPIPDDCDELFIFAPTQDFTESEIADIENYIDRGGSVMVFCSSGENASTDGLKDMLKRYGIMQSDGYLADMKRAYIDSYFQFFVTFTKDNDITGNFKEDDKALVEFARPLTQVEPTKEGVTLTTFLKTSFNTYEVTQEGETMDTYNVGMMAKNEQGGSLTVISAQTLVDENILTQYTSFKNMEIVTNAVSSALGLENISIPEKSLSVTNNAVKNGFIIALPFMIVIPVLLIAVGLFTWSRKKKR